MKSSVITRTFGVYKLPILSGVLIGTSYIPFAPWALLFCLVPLWIFMEETSSLKTRVIGTSLTGFTTSFIGFFWVLHTLHDFGQLNWVIAFSLSLLFHFLSQLFFPLYGIVAHFILPYFKKLSLARLSMHALMIIFLHQIVPTIFPWNFGYPLLYARIPLFQWADIIGFWGLSGMIVFFNIFSYFAYTKRKPKIFIALLFICALLSVSGYYKTLLLPHSDKDIDIQVVQSGIGNRQALKKYKPQVVNEQRAMAQPYMEEALNTWRKQKRPLISLWGEGSLPVFFNEKSGVRDVFKQFSMNHQMPIVTGSYWRDKKSYRPQASMIFFDSSLPQPSKVYHKRKLVPFGETIPYSKEFPQIAKTIYKWVPNIGNFKPGEKSSPISFSNILWGPLVCYEGLFPPLSLSLAEKQTEIFLNISNDSWYDSYQEPTQHLYMSLARAVEFRRPFVRATNTGRSGAILASGEILKLSPYQNTPWSYIYNIKYIKNPHVTFYQKYPYAFQIILISIFMVLVLNQFIRRLNLIGKNN